ncbi:RNA polymerase sigma factor [Gelidibacter maritimus]|uniref:RNA polymerase sigma factor n=1 Tax=Gelidibacter maritimus TaxID=2761487 RepID=UPI00293BD81B|nr:RNA polymerase sigma factor [Gelidibacter maritimus]
MEMDFSDNFILVEALRNGNEHAYSFLMDTYHHQLCVYAYGLTRDYDQAEDIVQNVLVRIWRKRHNLKTDFSFKSYLYRSVYNEFIDHYRKQKKSLNT